MSLDLTHRRPYQLGLERWPLAVEIRPVFEGSFTPNQGWKVTGTVRGRVSLDAPRLAFGDLCRHEGPLVTRKVRAKVHVPLLKLEAEGPPNLATASVESLPNTINEYVILISPRPSLPVGPFQFEVRIRAIDADGTASPCAAIDVYGEMQPTTRVFPTVVIFGARNRGEKAKAEIRVDLPSADWTVVRVEVDSKETAVSVGRPGPDRAVPLTVEQTFAEAGSRVSHGRIVVGKPGGQTEDVAFEVRYEGLDKKQ